MGPTIHSSCNFLSKDRDDAGIETVRHCIVRRLETQRQFSTSSGFESRRITGEEASRLESATLDSNGTMGAVFPPRRCELALSRAICVSRRASLACQPGTRRSALHYLSRAANKWRTKCDGYLRRDSSPLWEWSTSSVPRHKKNDLSLVFSDVGNGYAMHPPNRPGMHVQHPAYRRDMHAEYSLRQERAQCRRIRCPAPRNEPSRLRHTDKGTGRHEAAGFAFGEVSADVADAFLLARLFFGLRLRR